MGLLCGLRFGVERLIEALEWLVCVASVWLLCVARVWQNGATQCELFRLFSKGQLSSPLGRPKRDHYVHPKRPKGTLLRLVFAANSKMEAPLSTCQAHRAKS